METSDPRVTPSRRPRPIRRRGLVAALLLAVAATVAPSLGVRPALAAIPASYPTQSLGDRGTDVATIQRLLRHRQAVAPPATGGRTVIVRRRNPIVIPVDGIFGASTADGVRGFQASVGMARTGIVEGSTWAVLVVPLALGSSGEAVSAVQALLREKRAAAVPLDGAFGASTRSAVISFQQHAGLATTGAADAATWRSLVGHYELPRFSSAALCDYSGSGGAASWGRAETVAVLEATGAAAVGAGLGRVAVGDVSLEHGGVMPGHETHAVGLDADIRPMRDANDQCSSGTRWTLSTYDRAATQAVIRAIRAAAAGHVKLIYFNDPVLIREGLTTWYTGHENHLHLRICEATHPGTMYDC